MSGVSRFAETSGTSGAAQLRPTPATSTDGATSGPVGPTTSRPAGPTRAKRALALTPARATSTRSTTGDVHQDCSFSLANDLKATGPAANQSDTGQAFAGTRRWPPRTPLISHEELDQVMRGRHDFADGPRRMGDRQGPVHFARSHRSGARCGVRLCSARCDVALGRRTQSGTFWRRSTTKPRG
jgi:hypothetical protein